MDISILCVLLAAIMPYILVAYAKFSEKGYDNHLPREHMDKKEGVIKRAYAAHLNSFEAFPAFAAVVILGHFAGVSMVALSLLSVLFIVCRIFYGIFYILDKASLRSTVWFIGLIVVITMYILVLIAL